MAVAALGADSPRANPWLPWALLALGLASMYVPVYLWAAGDIWQSDEHAHGPLILIVAIWIFWREKDRILAAGTGPAPAVGIPIFAFGLLLYVLGRIMGFSILQFLAQMPLVAGIVLAVAGPAALRAAWFPLLYLIFMVPLPGVVVDAVTGHLKQWVSVVAEELLYAAGYPIARSGVTLTVGQYQLLVADACSGLNSMFSLAALGALFIHIMGRKSRLHTALLVLSIVPIAFAANIVRVISLVLITYHFGDAAGQGFLHGAAGIVLMLVALAAFFVLDWVLARWLTNRPTPGTARA
jgi:exosortase B